MYIIKQEPEDFFVKEISNIEISDKGKYTYFVLKKKNYTVMRALKQISEVLHIPLKKFGFAGTKDKKAVTEQVISLENISKERIENIKLKDIELNYLGKGNQFLCLGDLEGNYFEIILRDVDEKPSKMTKFRNLFGEQRFSKNNADVGKAIIKKDFEKAVNLILENDREYDIKIKEHLEKNKHDFVGALKIIPPRILRIYIHAYQSLLWNKMAETSDEEELPLIGFATMQTPEVKQILKQEEITTRDFVIKQIPNLSSEGTERNVFAEAKDLKIEEIDGKIIKLTFILPKGSYATVFVRQLFISQEQS